jgi:hypothetical protein
MFSNSIFGKLAIIIVSCLLLTTFSNSSFAQKAIQATSTNQATEKAKTPLGELLDSQPTNYSARQVYKQADHSNTINYAQKGTWQRIDTEQNGITMIVISRTDKDNQEKRYMIVPDKKGYSELFGNSALFLRKDPFYLQQARTLAPRNVKIENLGTDTIGGHPCTKYKISYDEASHVKNVTIWKAIDLQGLIIRQDLDFFQFKDSVELENVSLDVSDSLFELPKDLKLYTNAQEMFQKKPEKNPYSETAPIPK